MKYESILDKVIFSVAQVLTVFGLLMYLFLKMLSLSAYDGGYSVSYTMIGLVGLNGFFQTSYLGLFIFFIVAMLFALADIICLIVRLASGKEMESGFHIAMSSVGVIIAIIMLVSLNIINGDNGMSSSATYVLVRTDWGWPIGVCGAGVVVVAVYLAIKYSLKGNSKEEVPVDETPAETPEESEDVKKDVEESAAKNVKESPAHDDMTIIELIRAYKQLLDEGAITQEEFDKKKSELLK